MLELFTAELEILVSQLKRWLLVELVDICRVGKVHHLLLLQHLHGLVLLLNSLVQELGHPSNWTWILGVDIEREVLALVSPSPIINNALSTLIGTVLI